MAPTPINKNPVAAMTTGCVLGSTPTKPSICDAGTTPSRLGVGPSGIVVARDREKPEVKQR